MKKIVTLFFIGITFFSIPNQAVSADDKETLISLIREGNRSSIAAIRTIYAKYETVHSSVGTKPPVSSTEWWQEGDRIRWKNEWSGESVQPNNNKARRSPRIVGTEGVIQSDGGVKIRRFTKLTRNGKETSSQGFLDVSGSDVGIPNDLRTTSLFIPLTRPKASLSELLNAKGRLKSISAERIGLHLRYRIIVQSLPPTDNYLLELVVDPARNFLVSSCSPRTDSPKEVLRFEKQVSEFQECAPGIYFPRKVESKTFAIKPDKSNQLIQINTTSFHTVVVNEPIDPRIFSLDFSPGTSVIDKRNQTQFVMGKDNKPEDPVRPAPAASNPILSLPSYETKGQSSLGWIVGLTVILVTCAVITWFWWKSFRNGQV